MSLLAKLSGKGLAHPPKWLPDNVMYETLMGSVAYGVANTQGSDISDFDIYGFCMPPKHVLFPHLVGVIHDFDKGYERFDQYQEHHIKDPDALGGKGREYDLSIYNIVKYFRLCMENNPNMIDSMFTDVTCVLHCAKIGQMVRERRRIFLHKGAWHTFKGYAYSQLHKMQTKDPTGKRKEIREKFGFDVKFAYHVVRLINEVEQILGEGDLDLMRSREQLKAIRRGEWTEQQIREWFERREKELNTLYVESKLPYTPSIAPIKQLLIDCLEEHYGNLERCVITPGKAEQAILDIKKVIERAGV